jgi:hypothetical protein
MALGSTQPLTEMSTRNIPGGEGRPARKADNLTVIYEPIVYKMWEPQHLTALWVSTARYKDTFTFYVIGFSLKFLDPFLKRQVFGYVFINACTKITLYD